MRLVLVEHDGQQLKSASLHGLTVAQQLGGEVMLLVIGCGLDTIANELSKYGASRVLVADDPSLSHELADRYAAVLCQVISEYKVTTLIGSHSTFTKDIMPRAAAILDWPMVSDVISTEVVDGSQTYCRPVHAGNVHAMVVVEGECCALSIRAAAFSKPSAVDTSTPIQPIAVDPGSFSNGTEWISEQRQKSDRPELTEARVVIGGGRPLADSSTFEKLIGELANVLGGAVGATRAAVDAGIAPNDWQIGQTGKVIAPELYFAIGISGAIQHLAGIKDARVIVVINNDPEAPIFQMATYGLVGDLFQCVPELIEELHHCSTNQEHGEN